MVIINKSVPMKNCPSVQDKLKRWPTDCLSRNCLDIVFKNLITIKLRIGYSMFCAGYGLHTSVYFITNTKHCIINLALTQQLPVLVTSQCQIVKYTHCVVFCCISFRSLSFLIELWMRSHGTNAFVLDFFQSYLGIISLIIRYRCIG